MAKKIIDIDWIITNQMNFLEKFGLYESVIRQYYEDWKKLQPEASANDYLWHVFQTLLDSVVEKFNTEEQLYELNFEIYSKMREFLVKVEKRNANHILKMMNENQLRLWKIRANFKSEVEIISGHCCEFCDSLNNKRISFEEAIEKRYLASKNCTNKYGCNCCYSQVSVKDENGNLILFKK